MGTRADHTCIGNDANQRTSSANATVKEILGTPNVIRVCKKCFPRTHFTHDFEELRRKVPESVTFLVGSNDSIRRRGATLLFSTIHTQSQP